ncbi:MAG: Rpn family recombination-promoting nuclease/putative transposase [Myxococcaceae bacterium]|nr:Rpn family recombination-promoting nuclease/putative transposase [Myxococcaceae bacterium]
MTGRTGRGRHDGYFRSAFADKRVVAAEVQAMVPEALFRRLDLGRVEVVGARSADERLSTPESDAVFRVPTVSRDAQVFVLLEHQRDAPRMMPWRVLRYVTRFWAAHLAANPAMTALPPVVPLVVANVPGGWKGPRTLDGIIDGSPELREVVRPFLPNLELAIDDLATLDARAVLARPGPPVARLAWWLLSLSTDLSRVNQEATLMYPTIKAVRETAPEHHKQAMVYLRSLPMTTAQRRQMNEVFEVISMEEYRRRVPFLQDIVREEELQKARLQGQRRGMTQGLAEGRKRGLQKGLHEGRQKGLHEGRQKGLHEGVHEGLRMGILAQWGVRFGRRPARSVTTRLARADLETLMRWTQRLATAKRPSDVFD